MTIVTVSETPIIIKPDNAQGPAGPSGATSYGTREVVNTVADIAITHFDAATKAVTVLGYSTPGVGGFTIARVNSQPTHAWKFQSADGGWWEGVSDNGAVELSWFGGVSDGTTNNALPLLDFQSWALYYSALNPGRIYLRMTPNVSPSKWVVSCSDSSTSPIFSAWVYQAFTGIPLLEIDGRGSTFQVTSATPSSWPLPGHASTYLDLISFSYANDLIKNAYANDDHVTIKNPGTKLAYFHVGDWVMVACHASQFGDGTPANFHRFDYRQITAIDTNPVSPTYGKLTFSEWISEDYLDSFLDYSKIYSAIPYGAARVYVMDNYTSNGLGAGIVQPSNDYAGNIVYSGLWNIDHIVRDLTILPALGATLSQMIVTGRHVHYVDCTFPGIVESRVAHFSTDSCTTTNLAEDDKCVELVTHKNLRGLSLNFQSASIKSVILDNCYITSVGGAPRNLTIDGGRYGQITLDVATGYYGWAQSLSIRGAQIGKGLIENLFYAPIVSSSDFTFANGTFSVPKTGPTGLAFLMFGWEIGQQILMCHSDHYFPGDAAIGYIVRKRDDVSYWYFDTTFPYDTFPSWSTGISPINRHTIDARGVQTLPYIQTQPDRYINDPMRHIAEASAKGKNFWEYTRFMFGYNGPNHGTGDDNYTSDYTWPWTPVGKIKRIAMSVSRVPDTPEFAGIKFAIYVATADPANIAAGAPGLGVLYAMVDCSAAGKREIHIKEMGALGSVGAPVTGLVYSTFDGSIGANDWVDFRTVIGTPAGSRIDVLPPALVSGTLYWTWVDVTKSPVASGSTSYWKWPLIEVEVETDAGIYRKPWPSIYSDVNYRTLRMQDGYGSGW